MRRKATKNTRGPSADERAYMAWCKQQPCCICGAPGPSIVDHMYGSTFRHNKVLIGMWALLPYCQVCDSVKTQGSHRAHLKTFGISQADIWATAHKRFEMETNRMVPFHVVSAIADWGR